MVEDIVSKLLDSEKTLFVGLAGPGTGKSYTFTKIIQSEKFKDKKILILSFINKLVDDLSNEYNGFENVEVATLHSFAFQKIGNLELDPRLDKYVSEDFSFINDNAINYDHLFYLNELTLEAVEFYKMRKSYYENGKKIYSFNSVVYALNKLFEKNPDKIPQYDLILIDEFQDFNKLEIKLIEFLRTKNKVLLVGDDDQSLYAFKKASPEEIRKLYQDVDSMGFSLDYCYRCTKVIVNAVNSLIINAKKDGLLLDRLDDKKFLYPIDDANHSIKHELSEKYDHIYFKPASTGAKLIHDLATNITDNYKNCKGRVLILCPSYLKQSVFDGLNSKGFNVVDYELFSSEEKNGLKHAELIEIFEILTKRKTDNLSLRKILFLYLTESGIRDLVKKTNAEGKKIWSYLDDDTKTKILNDIDIFKKVKKGKDELSNEELLRFSKIFNLKNLLSKMIKKFNRIQKGAIEVELTTTISSKGLSAEYVYYLGIDDSNMLDKEKLAICDKQVCEFLVGITRAKSKLTLISQKDSDPKILKLIDSDYIQTI